jgi:hypothetical protein
VTRHLENYCSDIYAETKVFYWPIHDDCGQQGYQILLGPPLNEPPLLFLGYQPGRGLKSPEEERSYGSEDRWPAQSEYVTESWRLAQNLRGMFGAELLSRCVGLNAIFVRSPTMAAYGQINRQIRLAIAEFCLSRVEKIVRTMRPKLVVAVGLGTLRLFDCEGERLTSSVSGRLIAQRGEIGSYPALGTLHLSGARISNSDRQQIRDHILNTAGIEHVDITS